MSGVQDQLVGLHRVGVMGVRDERGGDGVDRLVGVGGVRGVVSVSELDGAGGSGPEAFGVVVSSCVGSGRGAFGACVVGVGCSDFVGVLWYGTDEEAARRVWGSLWEKRRCVVCVSCGLVIAVVGGFGVCGGVA
jgi:hypothetical protein